MNKEINLFYNNDNQYKGQIDTKMSTKHYTEFYSLSNSNTTETKWEYRTRVFQWVVPAPLMAPSVVVSTHKQWMIFVTLICDLQFLDRFFLSFFLWPLCCLSFDLRILVTLVSSSYSSLFRNRSNMEWTFPRQ